jgi:glycosyltransferase involved in cell wall biosynthesis
VPIKRSARVVVSCHDVIPLLSEFWGNRSRKSLAPGWHLYRRAIANLPKADAVIVSTSWTRQLLADLVGVSQERLWVLPYGVDDAFHCAQWSPPKDVVRLLHVGSNASYKRIDLVVDAAIRLASLSTRVELVKAGPALPPALVQRAIASGVTIVQHSEPVDGSLRTPHEQAAIYAQASVLLHPSEHEGFGLPVAEALAVGLPVVASSIETLREVSGGHAEHVVSSGEALAASVASLATQPAIMDRMSAAGKKWARRYQWATYARSLNQIYQAISDPLVLGRVVGE